MKKSNIIKFPKTDTKFSDLEMSYQGHFIKEYILAVVAFIAALLFCIFSKRYIDIIFCVVAVTLYSLYLWSQIRDSLVGKITAIDLTVIDIERKETKLLGSFSKDMTTSRTCNIKFEDNNKLRYVMSVPFSSAYKTGDIVRIYMNNGSASQLNQNTYTILNPVYMHIISSS